MRGVWGLRGGGVIGGAMGVWGYSVYCLRFWNLRRCSESGFWVELRWLGKKNVNRDLGRVFGILVYT